MEIFAMIFAIMMIAAAVAATIFVGMFSGGIGGALAFAALLVVTYRATTRPEIGDHEAGPIHGHNAFQRWASRD